MKDLLQEQFVYQKGAELFNEQAHEENAEREEGKDENVQRRRKRRQESVQPRKNYRSDAEVVVNEIDAEHRACERIDEFTLKLPFPCTEENCDGDEDGRNGVKSREVIRFSVKKVVFRSEIDEKRIKGEQKRKRKASHGNNRFLFKRKGIKPDICADQINFDKSRKVIQISLRLPDVQDRPKEKAEQAQKQKLLLVDFSQKKIEKGRKKEKAEIATDKPIRLKQDRKEIFEHFLSGKGIKLSEIKNQEENPGIEKGL